MQNNLKGHPIVFDKTGSYTWQAEGKVFLPRLEDVIW